MTQIIHNQITTPDGTVLTSNHTHDYQSHIDANGKYYFVDGGHSYVRSSTHDDQIHLTLTTDDPHLLVREHLLWGTRGINGDRPLHYLKLKDMDSSHIENVLKLIPSDHPYVPYYSQELSYRQTLKDNL